MFSAQMSSEAQKCSLRQYESFPRILTDAYKNASQHGNVWHTGTCMWQQQFKYIWGFRNCHIKHHWVNHTVFNRFLSKFDQANVGGRRDVSRALPHTMDIICGLFVRPQHSPLSGSRSEVLPVPELWHLGFKAAGTMTQMDYKYSLLGSAADDYRKRPLLLQVDDTPMNLFAVLEVKREPPQRWGTLGGVRRIRIYSFLFGLAVMFFITASYILMGDKKGLVLTPSPYHFSTLVSPGPLTFNLSAVKDDAHIKEVVRSITSKVEFGSRRHLPDLKALVNSEPHVSNQTCGSCLFRFYILPMWRVFQTFLCLGCGNKSLLSFRKSNLMKVFQWKGTLWLYNVGRLYPGFGVETFCITNQVQNGMECWNSIQIVILFMGCTWRNSQMVAASN